MVQFLVCLQSLSILLSLHKAGKLEETHEIRALLGVSDRFIPQRSVLISGFSGFSAILFPGLVRLV